MLNKYMYIDCTQERKLMYIWMYIYIENKILGEEELVIGYITWSDLRGIIQTVNEKIFTGC